MSDGTLDIDDDALKSLGPAMIRALGGPDAVAEMLAAIVRKSASDQTQLKALALAVQCVKTSAEAMDDDPIDAMELEDIDEEIRKLTEKSQGTPQVVRDGSTSETRP